MIRWRIPVLALVAGMLAIVSLVSAAAGQVVGEVSTFNSDGSLIGSGVYRPNAPVARPVPPGPSLLLDHWCCGKNSLDWNLNEDFFIATAFDTRGIVEPYRITEVRWFARGGQKERYWIAADIGSGLPDPSSAILLGGQSSDDSSFQWQSFAVVVEEAEVEPGQVYWFIRQSLSTGFNMTWRSSINPEPPIVDPVAASSNISGVWGKVWPGLGWHLEFQIWGESLSRSAVAHDSSDAR